MEQLVHSAWSMIPFGLMLLTIAVAPLIVNDWWDSNRHKLAVSTNMYAGEDKLKRNALDLQNESLKLANNVDNAIKKGGKEIDKAEKKKAKKSSAALRKAIMKLKIEKVTEADYNNILTLKEELEKDSSSILARYGEQ